MNEEVFNLEVRKFLKRFGVTAQREIEKSVATLTIPGVLPELQIDGEIALS
jgi:hypothetical protein